MNKVLPYDEVDPLPLGLSLPEIQRRVTSEVIGAYVHSIGAEDNPALSNLFAVDLVPPGIFASVPAYFPGKPSYDSILVGGLRSMYHSGCSWQFRRQLTFGEELKLRWRVAERWTKRGNDVAVYAFDVLDMSEREILHCRFRETMSGIPTYARAFSTQDASRKDFSTSAGTLLGSITRTFTYDMCKAWTGSEPSWHNDMKVAREWGYDDAIVLGSQFNALMCELMSRLFGIGFAEGGTIATNNLRLTTVKKPITAYAVESGRTNDSDGVERVTVAIFCADEAGNKISAGIATARVVNAETAGHYSTWSVDV